MKLPKISFSPLSIAAIASTISLISVHTFINAQAGITWPSPPAGEPERGRLGTLIYPDFSNSRVGIGTTTPGYNLEISGASNPLLVVTDTTNTARTFIQSQNTWGGIGTTSAHDLYLYTGGSAKGALTTGGNLGIGTTSPTHALEVSSNTNEPLYINGNTFNQLARFYSNDDNASIIIQDNDAAYGIGVSGTNFVIDNNASLSSPEYTFDTNGTLTATAFVGDGSGLTGVGGAWTVSGSDVYRSSGNVGIGTTGPSSILDINSSQNGDVELKVQNPNTGSSARAVIGLYSDTTNESGIITVSSGAYSTVADWADSMTVQARSDLDGGLVLYSPDKIRLQNTAGTDVLTATSGNVGIGTTDPTAKLHIENGAFKLDRGTGAPSAQITFSSSDGIFLLYDDAGNTEMRFHADNDSYTNLNAGNFGIATSTPRTTLDVKGQITGGFGAATTGGTADWNHSTNIRTGMGNTLLQGSSTNGPSAAGTAYYHPFNFEYATKDGSGNLTQLAIPYGLGSSLDEGIYMRGRYQGTWNAWRRIISSEASGDVGIGTSDPETKLHVVGTVKATAFVGDGSGLTGVGGAWTVSGSDVYRASGNVGIGTSGPGAKLEVSGDILLSTGANRTIKVATNTEIEGAGYNLTVSAGDATPAQLTSGGQLHLKGGDASNYGPTSGTGGDVYIYGGHKSAPIGALGNVILAHSGSLEHGNVGIGDNTPASLFTVGNGDKFRIDSVGATTVSAVNTASSSLNALHLTGTLGAFNGSDTFRGIYVQYTNANHTGTSNVVNAIQVAGIVGDAEAVETAFNIGSSGWDVDINLQNGERILNTTNGTVTIDDGATAIFSGNTTTVQLNLSAQIGGTAQRLCHNGADAATGVQNIGDCGATQADLAEYYEVTDNSEAGDIVSSEGTAKIINTSQGESTIASVNKSSSKYDSKILGVISTNPSGEVMGEMAKDHLENPKAVALVGRVPVKVSSINGEIKPGDFITSSSIPGVGMKATESGMVIGQALSAYTNPDPNSIGKVVIYVNPTYYIKVDEIKNIKDQIASLLQGQEELNEDVAGIKKYVAEVREEIYSTKQNVGIMKSNPNSALDVHGYVELDQSNGLPPSEDCDEASEIGRMKVDSESTNLYVCTAQGWSVK